MIRPRKIGTAASLLLALVVCPESAWAADPVNETMADGWSFTAAAYVWGTGLNGQVGVLGLPPQDVDLSFGDILEKLDVAVMGIGEARNGRFLLSMDLTYSRVSADVGTPFGIVADKIDVTAATWMVSGYGGYSVLDTDTVRLDLLGGARLWSVQSDFELKGGLLDGGSRDDGVTWVDPVVGAKIRLDLAPDIYAVSWAMIGGFGVGSDLMWDLMAGAGYDINDNWSLFGGYRAVSVDYRNNGFVYDVVQQGPVVAAIVRF